MSTKTKPKKKRTPAGYGNVSIPRPEFNRCAAIAAASTRTTSTAGVILGYVRDGLAADEAKKEGAK